MNKENSLFLRDSASPESILRARGIYLNGSKTEDISGVALYASGICSPYPWLDRIVVLLGVEQSETLFVLAWSRTNTWIWFGPPNPPHIHCPVSSQAVPNRSQNPIMTKRYYTSPTTIFSSKRARMNKSIGPSEENWIYFPPNT